MEPVDGLFCLVTLVEVGMQVLRVCLLIYKLEIENLDCLINL